VSVGLQGFTLVLARHSNSLGATQKYLKFLGQLSDCKSLTRLGNLKLEGIVSNTKLTNQEQGTTAKKRAKQPGTGIGRHRINST
jgi:hypothetical protein